MGSVVPYGGATLPTGWRWADGAAISRTVNAELFAVVGTAFGSGDGSTTFNVPDMRQRFPLGKATTGTGSTLGASGGAIDHVHGATLSGHSHAATLGAHTHGLNAFASHAHTWQGTGLNPPDGSFYGTYYANLTSTDASCGGACTPGNVTSTTGGGGTFTSSTATQSLSASASNPPFVALNYIVKATASAVAPCGAVWLQARSTPPAGAVAADGAARSRTTSSALYGCVGTTFGAGDGSTTFNVPNLRQRFPLGTAAAGTGAVLGSSGGAIDHANSFTGGAHSHAFNIDHSHQATEPSHAHGVQWPANNFRVDGSTYGFWGVGYLDGTTTAGSGGTATSTTAGGASAPTATDGTSAATATAANPPFQSLETVVYDAGTDGYSVATGTVVPYAGSTEPPGWMFADGRALSRTAYADLFASVGISFGPGDGSTTFNLPDLRQRIPLGRAASGTGSVLGGMGGSIDHTHGVTVPTHSHTFAPPGHGHSFTFGNHTHQVTRSPMNSSWLVNGCCGSGNIIFDYGPITTSASGAQTVGSSVGSSGTVTTSAAGGSTVTSTSQNPPYLVTNYLVAVDVLAPTPDPPTGSGVADSASQITWTITGAADEAGGSGLHSTPYSFDNGATWQASATLVQTGLTANAPYSQTIRVRDAARNVTTASTILRYTLPGAPTSPTASGGWNATDGYNVALGWIAPPSGATSYRVRWSVDAYAGVQGSPTATSFVRQTLTANTAYSFRICAANADGAVETTCSSTVSATTPPGPPTSPTTTTITDSSVTFDWTTATGATSTELRVFTDSTCSTLLSTHAGVSAPFTRTGLLVDRPYWYRLRSYSTASAAWGASTGCLALSGNGRTSISIALDASNVSLGTAVPGIPTTGSSTITVGTYGATGYTISASAPLLTSGSLTIPGTTSGTVGSPPGAGANAWTGTGFGITVASATNLEAGWSAGTRWARLSTTSETIHATGAAFAANSMNNTGTVVNYRLVIPSSQAPGSYNTSITYTALATP